MFIQSEPTPNPEAMRFLPGIVTGGPTVEIKDRAGARTPLTQALFALAGVERLLLGYDFVTVVRTPATDWDTLRIAVVGVLADALDTGRALHPTDARDGETTDDDETTGRIRALIDDYVRPMVARDGGDIVFQGFADGIVHVDMRGSCSGCPSSTFTLRQGIERMLRHYVPEVVEVRAVGA